MDILPLHRCKAIWFGVVEGLGLPDWMTWVTVLGLGPQMVKWPDGEESFSKWGVLMGLPLSWSILCIIHLWWA